MRRIPLWLTLVPLVVGGLLYWRYWDGERAEFAAALSKVFDRPVAVGGFPYRLEAEVPAPRLRHDGPYRLEVRAERLQANRQPSRQALTSLGLLRPSLSWRATGVDGAVADITAATGQSSLHFDGARIARLSNVYQDARLRLPLLPVAATAKSFEWHFRETPAATDPASRAPTYPEQAQLVLAGEGVRFGQGDPLALSAQIGVTSASPVWDLAGWRRGGTVELRKLTLSDAHGEVVAMTATLSAGVSDGLRAAGTIDTVCPISLRAAFGGALAPAKEFRTRRPVRIAFGGAPGAISLAPEASERPMPVRNHEPPCPQLR